MNLTNTVSQKMQEFIRTLSDKPKSKKDYIKILGLYFSKRFLIFSVVAVCVGGPFLVSFVMPWLEGRLWTAKIRVDSAKLMTFSGKAKILDTNGTTVFKGKLDNGAPTGSGLHYSEKGELIYKGDFKGGKYEGSGELFSGGKNLIYSGDFKNNLYEGNGKLYNSSTGKILYDGAFEKGKKCGRGIEYDPSTSVKKYFGEFLNDLRHGHGAEYTENGENVYYEGAFELGKYHGEGKIYSGKSLLYSGMFANGLYDGNGTLYNPETGAVVYTGSFKDGLYDGDGSLYDFKSGALIYSGAFSQGKRQGSGTSYDKLGGEVLTGKFYNDSIDYIGCLGQTIDELTEKFGKETFRTEVDSRLLLAFTGNNFVAVMKVDNEKNEYACEKLLIGTKNEFMGIGAKSTAAERRNILGDPFTSTNFNAPDYYKTAFSNLSINITNTRSIPSDKYFIPETSKYFIRLYFNEGKTELKFIEICRV